MIFSERMHINVAHFSFYNYIVLMVYINQYACLLTRLLSPIEYCGRQSEIANVVVVDVVALVHDHEKS